MIEVRLPQTSDRVSESVIVFWYKSEGDRVQVGDVLVEIQTEKATFEISAPADGVLRQIRVQRAEVARVGDILCYIDPSAEENRSPEPLEASTPVDDEKTEPSGSSTRTPFVSVAPRLRRLAQELGVDLTKVTPTGPGGRITEADIRRAAHGAKEFVNVPSDVHVAAMRRTIARRMMQSLQESAQLTLTTWADVTDLYQRRRTLCAEATWNDWIARAVVIALQQHPYMNAVWKNDSVQIEQSIHLGIAVDTDAGLVVPVVRNAAELSLEELHRAVSDLTHRAREGRLSAGELSGSTFTVSNLGTYGVAFFTPILNPPEAGILGIGELEESFIWDDGQVRPRYRIPLSLTFDHRVTDGGPAARFLGTIRRLLQEPESLL